jgi:3-hydroxyisobutyrate dehydrogenase-like beta-hydroxyacid dehydrogenase
VLPSTITELVEIGASVGVTVIDAAVSGGSERSGLGRLTILIGGADEPVKYCWPYFEAIGAYQFHLGPAGTGAAAKLVNNVLTIGGYALIFEAMELAAAYGIDEDAVASFVPVSSGDMRSVRTWGKYDRSQREHTAAGTPAIYYMYKKDLVEAVLAAAEHGLTLPLVSVTAGLMTSKLMERDRMVLDRGPLPNIPMCSICGQELAPPFRVHGVHPECRPFE